MPIRVMRKVGGEELPPPVCHSLVDFLKVKKIHFLCFLATTSP